MKYNITVDKAITKGKLIAVLIPVLFIFATPCVLAAFFGVNPLPVVGGAVLGFLLSILSWSIGVTYWRIWAFGNVRNVHQLKKRALMEKIIWRDGHFFEKTEIRTAKQKEKLRQLNERFLEDDVFYDDPSVPDATYIYVSKRKARFEAFMGVTFIITGICFYFFSDVENQRRMIYYAPPIGLFMIYQSYRKLKDIKPVIILDNEGIRLKGKGLISWESIHGEHISYHSERHFFQFIHHEGRESIDITNLDIKHKQLMILIDIYRVRHEKNNTVSVN